MALLEGWALLFNGQVAGQRLPANDSAYYATRNARLLLKLFLTDDHWMESSTAQGETHFTSKGEARKTAGVIPIPTVSINRDLLATAPPQPGLSGAYERVNNNLVGFLTKNGAIVSLVKLNRTSRDNSRKNDIFLVDQADAYLVATYAQQKDFLYFDDGMSKFVLLAGGGVWAVDLAARRLMNRDEILHYLGLGKATR
ncbi:hypothetical protein [Hymenobacter koreensis]|uniref:hypothetical protein n=1 Tax=Hymenobacter koreensis TaxID=1084523 RepID=UPI0031EAC007